MRSYLWHNSQHINAVEYLAFLNYIRSMVSKEGNFIIRFVHMLDSRVVSCVIVTGRSRSTVFNRIARRVSVLSLASNFYLTFVARFRRL